MINTRVRSPFTASQWQELEDQALIFKYMIAGIPVPPDLLLPIKRSFNSISASLLHQQSLGWGCLQMGFGRKPDPEPGRCRRTDGKKWRCSKDVFPDSKYCERHMHRSRNRSRKHVEVNPSSATQPSPSPLNSSQSKTLMESNHHGLPFQATQQVCRLSTAFDIGFSPKTSSLPLQLDSGQSSSSDRDCRYFQALKEDPGEHSFLSKGPGSSRSNESVPPENQWSLMQLKLGCLEEKKKESHGSVLHNGFSQFMNIELNGQRQQQYSFLGSDLIKSEREGSVPEVQPLRCFFNDWPKARDGLSGYNEDRSSNKSFSTTQLSISIPMASSDFSSNNL